MKKIILILLILLINLSCSSSKMNYDKMKIDKKVSKNYSILLDGKSIEFNETYLNKDNIESTTLNRKKKQIEIIQKSKSELLKIENLKSDSLKFDNITLVVIDGVPFSEEQISRINIDQNAIAELKILKQKELENTILCRSPDGDVLVIITKQ